MGVQERERQDQEVASLRASREAANTMEQDLQDKLNTMRNSCQKAKQATKLRLYKKITIKTSVVEPEPDFLAGAGTVENTLALGHYL